MLKKDGDRLFNLWLSEYMNTNMRRLGWTYKRTEKETGVPQTTLYSYAHGRTVKPDDDNLRRVVIAFGDDPEIIQKMRRESLDSTERENQLLAGATDKKRMEEFAALMRANMAAILDEYRQDDAARIEAEQLSFKERTEEVVRQCKEEMNRKDLECDRRIELIREHCDQRVADIKESMQTIIDEKARSKQEMTEQYTRSTTYLKISVSNLCIAFGILVVTNVFFGAYAIFAYTVFDMTDPSRGLHRDTHSVGPMMVFLAVVLLMLAAALMVSALLKRKKASKSVGAKADPIEGGV